MQTKAVLSCILSRAKKNKKLSFFTAIKSQYIA